MISYSTVQRELALRVRDRLALLSGPRIDCLDIARGARFQEQLAWWLSYCHAAVVLLSEDALGSRWVRYELSVLVNRERLGEVTVIVLRIGDLPVERLHELTELALGTLQGGPLAAHASDAEIDAAIADVAEVAGGDLVAQRFVEGVNGCLAGIRDTARLSRARLRLQRAVGGERDAWFDDAQLADIGDGGVRLRWALASELCATPAAALYAPLEELARDAAVTSAGVHRMADVSVMTVFDAASMATLHEQMSAEDPEARPGVVLGFTRQEMAELAPAAAQEVHVCAQHHPFWLHDPVTGSTPDEYVDGIAAQLERAIEDSGIDLGRLRRRRHPVVVLLARFDGLSKEILYGVRRRFPEFTFVVLSTEVAGPAAWSEKLGGLPVAGPRPDEDGWAALRDDEADLVDAWRSTKDDVCDTLAATESRP